MKRFFACAILFVAASGAASASSQRETPVVNVIREWAPSVVNISTERVVLLRQHPYWGGYDSFFQGFFDNFPTRDFGAVKLNNLGSGVIISEDGLIVTNAHVVQMASKIFVTLSDKTTVPAELIGANALDDMAVIRIKPPKPLKPVRIAKDVLIGETVVAVGNSLGLQNSVSAGIVSGVDRNLAGPQQNTAFRDLIQTDASINPGSSGGALLNLDGELVGINLALVQGAQNVAFAIPARKIQPVLDDYFSLKKQGKL